MKNYGSIIVLLVLILSCRGEDGKPIRPGDQSSIFSKSSADDQNKGRYPASQDALPGEQSVSSVGEEKPPAPKIVVSRTPSEETIISDSTSNINGTVYQRKCSAGNYNIGINVTNAATQCNDACGQLGGKWVENNAGVDYCRCEVCTGQLPP